MAFLKEHRQRLRSFYHGEFSYFLRITAIAFVLLAVGSFIFGLVVPECAAHIVAQFAQQVADLGIAQADGTVLAAGLFSNNFRAALFGMVYGFLPFIYLPALSLGINATMLGIFGAYSINNGLSFWYYLLGILPHGIFELPALVIAISLGLYLCRCTTLRIRKKTLGMIKTAFSECLRVLIMLVTPLLLIAAAVETYVTPHLISLFG